MKEMTIDVLFVFRPKKWGGVKVMAAFAIAFALIYLFLRNSFSDAWILIVVFIVFMLIGVFVYFLDFDKALLFADKVIVYPPLKKPKIIPYTEVEKVVIWEDYDSQYGNSLGVTLYLKNPLAEKNKEEKIVLNQEPYDKTMQRIVDFYKTAMSEKVQDKRAEKKKN